MKKNAPSPDPTSRENRKAEFDRLVERFFNEFHDLHPIDATHLGLHEHDACLDDFSPETVERETDLLERTAGELAAPTFDELDTPARVDRTLLGDRVAARLLDLNLIRTWRRDPCMYNDLATRGVHGLMTRPYAPLDERTDVLVERLRRIPDFFEVARANIESELSENSPLTPHPSALRGVPREYVETALLEYDGGLKFFEHDVPRVLDNVSNAKLRRKGYEAVSHVVRAYRRMLDWLRYEVSPRASEGFALGREFFVEKLRVEEHVTTPLDEILGIAEDKLRATQTRMRKLVDAIAPGEMVRDCIRRLSEREHPTLDEVLHAYEDELEDARRFILDRNLVSIPPGELRMEEMPPFLRDVTIAAIERPGPFERAELPSFFFVTLPDPHASSRDQAGMLRAHSRLMRQATIVHEAYPGHFVQGLHWSKTSSVVRKSFSSLAFVEGWAHYCEEMMAEQGYWDDDPKLLLFQEFDALLRIGRVIAGTRMHVGTMTPADAERFLESEVGLEPVIARMEVHRYKRDPLVLAYSWGKWELQRLRDDFSRERGSAFSLGEFHDEALAHGEPPIELLRELMFESNGTGTC